MSDIPFTARGVLYHALTLGALIRSAMFICMFVLSHLSFRFCFSWWWACKGTLRIAKIHCLLDLRTAQCLLCKQELCRGNWEILARIVTRSTHVNLCRMFDESLKEQSTQSLGVGVEDLRQSLLKGISVVPEEWRAETADLVEKVMRGVTDQPARPGFSMAQII